MIFILLYSFMMYFYTTATFLKKYFQIFILAGANEKETVNWWCRLKTQKRGEKFEEFFAARNAFQLSEGNASLPLKQINKQVLVNRTVSDLLQGRMLKQPSLISVLSCNCRIYDDNISPKIKKSRDLPIFLNIFYGNCI